MIEHFSKWLELVSLLDHIRSNERATYAFLNRALSRFEALAKVLTNQGMKSHGEFQKLCEKTLINRCTTSQDHHEANKLVEQMV
jgi:transposase-like protein